MCLAVPGRITSVTNQMTDRENAWLYRMGKVSFAGVIKEISLAYVPEAQVDDYVIVHAGVALSVVDQKEAEETLLELEHMQLL